MHNKQNQRKTRKKIITSLVAVFLFVSVFSIGFYQNQNGRTTTDLLPANLQALLKALAEQAAANKAAHQARQQAKANEAANQNTSTSSTTINTNTSNTGVNTGSTGTTNNNSSNTIQSSFFESVSQVTKSISVDTLRKGFGFNTERFVMTIEDTPARRDNLRSTGLGLAQETKPVLRFPGGNVGNVYHPNGNGYGYIQGEFPNNSFYNPPYQWSQSQATKNLMYYFMDQAKEMGVTDILYVANLYTGTVDEAIFVIDQFQKNGFNIVGVELGNELFFKPWSDKIKTVDQYVTIADSFAKQLKAKYPRIKLGVLAREHTGGLDGNIRNGFPIINNWNTAIAKMNNIDAIIVHKYGDVRTCSALNNLERTFDCAKNSTHFEYYDWGNQMADYYAKFTNKNIWFTEFNVEPSAERIGNTFLHAANIYEMLMQTLTPAFAEKLEFVIHHNLLSTGTGMPAYYRPSGGSEVRKSAQAYSLEMYKSALDKSNQLSRATIEAPILNPNDRNSKKDFVFRILETRNSHIVLFLNKSDREIQFAVKDGNKRLTSVVDQQVIGGPDIWSSLYSEAAYKNSKSNWATSLLRETEVSVDNNGLITVPKYHLGLIELRK